MFNYITFQLAEESTHRVPTKCMPPKEYRSLKEVKEPCYKASIHELDYISRPRTHYDHLARVLEAKRIMGLINY